MYLYVLAPLIFQIVCVIHCVRTGRIFPWIYLIVFLPLVGCIAYLAAEVVPEMLRSRSARQLSSNVRAAADPHRGLRQALRNAEMVGSVDAKRTLAEEYVRRQNYADAIALYQGMLTGQFRDDPALLYGLARAQFLAGDGSGAQANLDALQAADPKFVSADAHMLYARALELQHKDAEAIQEYRRLVRYYPGEEARCRFAMLLDRTGEREAARDFYAQILKSLEGAPRHYRKAQREWGDIAHQALKA